MTAPSARVTIPQVIDALREFGQQNPSACCLHVVLADGNYDLQFRQDALETAIARQHPLCCGVAYLLCDMSWTQVRKISRIMWR